jgi:hypothetical protein
LSAGAAGPDLLATFLREQAALPFDWASAHCLLLPADWMVRLGLPDPAGEWRGLSGEAEALCLVEQYGGPVDLAAVAMAGHPRVDVTNGVRRGDVGVVAVVGPDGPAEVGAICTGQRWAARGLRGLSFGPAEALAVWRPSVPGVREVI